MDLSTLDWACGYMEKGELATITSAVFLRARIDEVGVSGVRVSRTLYLRLCWDKDRNKIA